MPNTVPKIPDYPKETQDNEALRKLIREELQFGHTNEGLRQIIKEELAEFMFKDKFYFKRQLQVMNGRDIQFGTGKGTKIGTGTDQKLAFYGSTPLIQQTGPSQPSGGITQDAECRAATGALITFLQNIGLLA